MTSLASSNPVPTLKVLPANSGLVRVNGTFTVDIMVYDVIDLYGVDFKLHYDSNVVKVKSIVDLNPNNVLGTNPLVTKNVYDNESTTGSVWYAGSVAGNVYGFDGIGKIIRVEFIGVGAGVTDIYFGEYELIDAKVQPISASTEGNQVEITSGGSISGNVCLEGLTSDKSHSGIDVVLVGGPGGVNQTATTDVYGNYLFDDPGIYAGNYTVYAKKPGYLRNKYSVLVTGDKDETSVSSFQLLTGDINADNGVEMADFLILANAYDYFVGDSLYNIAADLNIDDKVSLYDLVWLARNYGKDGVAIGQ